MHGRINLGKEIPRREYVPRPTEFKLGRWETVSAAVFGALLNTGMLHLMSRPEVPTGMAAEKPAKAEKILKELEKIDSTNKEAVAELKRERAQWIDQTIDRYLDPKAPDYAGDEAGYIQPQESVYFELDARNAVIRYAESEQAKPLEIKTLEQRRKAYLTHLQTEYDQRLTRLAGRTDLTWTGDLIKDFPTYQQAAFVGPNRFFYHPDYADTVYRTHWNQFDQQLQTAWSIAQWLARRR